MNPTHLSLPQHVFGEGGASELVIWWAMVKFLSFCFLAPPFFERTLFYRFPYPQSCQTRGFSWACLKRPYEVLMLLVLGVLSLYSSLWHCRLTRNNKQEVYPVTQKYLTKSSCFTVPLGPFFLREFVLVVWSKIFFSHRGRQSESKVIALSRCMYGWFIKPLVKGVPWSNMFWIRTPHPYEND